MVTFNKRCCSTIIPERTLLQKIKKRHKTDKIMFSKNAPSDSKTIIRNMLLQVSCTTHRRRGCRPRTVRARERPVARDRNGTGRNWIGRPPCPPPRRTQLCRRRSWNTASARARPARRPRDNRTRRSDGAARCPAARARRPACPVWGTRGTRGRHWSPSSGTPPWGRLADTTSAPNPPNTCPSGRAAPSVQMNPSGHWKKTSKNTMSSHCLHNIFYKTTFTLNSVVYF